jgi:hypothetical protein
MNQAPRRPGLPQPRPISSHLAVGALSSFLNPDTFHQHHSSNHIKPLQRTLHHPQTCRPSKIKPSTTLQISTRRLVAVLLMRRGHRELSRVLPSNSILTSYSAFQVSSFEQFGAADFHSKGLRISRPYRDLFLLHLLQHWRSIPYKCRRICDSRILLSGGFVQCWEK